MFEEFHAGKANLYRISTLPFATVPISPGSKSPTATVTLYDIAVAQSYVSTQTAEQQGWPDSAQLLGTADCKADLAQSLVLLQLNCLYCRC